MSELPDLRETSLAVEPAAPFGGEDATALIHLDNAGAVTRSATLALHGGDPAAGGLLVASSVTTTIRPASSGAPGELMS